LVGYKEGIVSWGWGVGSGELNLFKDLSEVADLVVGGAGFKRSARVGIEISGAAGDGGEADVFGRITDDNQFFKIFAGKVLGKHLVFGTVVGGAVGIDGEGVAGAEVVVESDGLDEEVEGWGLGVGNNYLLVFLGYFIKNKMGVVIGLEMLSD
jgi:hypothetical protein